MISKTYQILHRLGDSMNKVVGFVTLLCILIFLVSCGEKTKNTSKTLDDSEDTIVINSAQFEFEIPQIAFLMSVDYSPVREEEPLETYVLYDQNGDVFYTEDPELTGISLQLLLEKYADGSISDKLTKVKTIEDKEGMQKCIDNLQGILHNSDYKIVDPGSAPDVLWEITRWSGLYYNENHELKSVYLRYSEYSDQKANDPRADEIIKFLTSN